MLVVIYSSIYKVYNCIIATLPNHKSAKVEVRAQQPEMRDLSKNYSLCFSTHCRRLLIKVKYSKVWQIKASLTKNNESTVRERSYNCSIESITLKLQNLINSSSTKTFPCGVLGGVSCGTVLQLFSPSNSLLMYLPLRSNHRRFSILLH
jgi:hypothetical protein